MPGDLVTSNHWEYQYYFRKLGPAFAPGLGFAKPQDAGEASRLWLVVEAATGKDRFQLLNAVTGNGWHEDEDHEFQNTSVFLLSRDARN